MTENVAIEKYFHLGYDYKTITDLLLVHHGITLKRRLKTNNLGKKKINVDEDLVRNIIRSEMCGSRKYPYPPHGRQLEIPRGRRGSRAVISEG